MSGPATPEETDTGGHDEPSPPCVEVVDARTSSVGGVEVRRALPQRRRRTVGAWCFLDHVGPTDGGPGMAVGPHPHIGLQTVTWLLDGELVHRDSLGSEQPIRPGQLNLMTAGQGVSHAEEPAGASGSVHGLQLWIAQPEATRHGPAAFEHHSELPTVALGRGTVTVLVGSLAGATSPARHDTDLVGADLALGPGTSSLPVERAHEHAVVVAGGALAIDGRTIGPGQLAYLGRGRDELPIEASVPVRALLVGGVPFPETVKMWWNYVARTADEISAAHEQWTARDRRFGQVASSLPSIDVGPPPWARRS